MAARPPRHAEPAMIAVKHIAVKHIAVKQNRFRRSAGLVLAGVILGTVLPGCPQEAGRESPVRTIEITTKSHVKMILIPGGTFTMGSEDGPRDESPAHPVTLSGFAMDKYEVTQEQYARMELPNPSQFKNLKRPVEQIRWSDAALFCNERSREEGLDPCYDEATFACSFEANGYRLPTEAEWEYAARAGTKGDFGPAASSAKLKSYACYAGTSKKGTDLVGQRKANAWGLNDMLGNVREWCFDVYSPGYYSHKVRKDPHGPASGKKRIMRGGGWDSRERGCRVTTRYAEIPGITDACFARNSFGFRCVRKLTAEEEKQLVVKNVAE